MPPNTVKVDRTTKWGNPFVTGRDGTRAYCVDLYCKMLRGLLALSCGPSIEEQRAARSYVLGNIDKLYGKNLACWCRDKPCHAYVLLDLAKAHAIMAHTTTTSTADSYGRGEAGHG